MKILLMLWKPQPWLHLMGEGEAITIKEVVGEERGGELELERANSEEEEVADSYDISRNPKARTETAKLLGCERAVLVCA